MEELNYSPANQQVVPAGFLPPMEELNRCLRESVAGRVCLSTSYGGTELAGGSPVCWQNACFLPPMEELNNTPAPVPPVQTTFLPPMEELNPKRQRCECREHNLSTSYGGTELQPVDSIGWGFAAFYLLWRN